MRIVTFAFVLATAAAQAAPVPADLKADRARLESLWDDLAAPRWVDRSIAVYQLLDHPKGVEFLCGKVKPVSATADDLKRWLKAINSDDEKVWKPAFAELQYHDPRPVLTTAEQVELVDTDAGKTRLMTLWVPGQIMNPEQANRVTLKVNGAKVWCEWHVGENGLSTEFEVPKFPGQDRSVWQRVALAAYTLHRADTKESRAALARLATGLKDARPTKAAAELLKAKVSAVADRFNGQHWDALLGGDPADTIAAVVALREAKNTPTFLKAKLPAIAATKDQIVKWVQAFDTDDRGAAFTELCYYRPTLALTLAEQCDLLSTDHGRGTLFQFWSEDEGRPPAWWSFGSKFQLIPTDQGLTLNWIRNGERPPPPLEAPVPELKQQTCAQWQRARLAILALERGKSDDAKAVLKQLADGHPEILPTREAKAALERLK
jgi:hypothetical protein